MSYAYVDGLSVEPVTREEFPQKLKSGNYAGAWILPDHGLSDANIFAISDFVKGGGRVFFEVWDIVGVDFAKSFENYLSISVAREVILPEKGKTYFLSGSSLALFDGLTVGFQLKGRRFDDSPSLNAFFLPKDNSYQTISIQSATTRLSRAIAAYGHLGKGDLILLMSYNNLLGAGYAIGASSSFSLVDDDMIDMYNNKEGSLSILRWLGGRK